MSYGIPRSNHERLINHFGLEKANEMIARYGQKAYEFLPVRGSGYGFANYDPNNIEMGIHYDPYLEPTVGQIPTLTTGKGATTSATIDPGAVAVPLAPQPPAEPQKLPIIPVLITLVVGYFLFGKKLGIR